MKVCLECGAPATHVFFAGRIGAGPAAVENVGFIQSYDALRHDRDRFVCQDCWESVRLRLESERFRVEPRRAL